MIFDHTVAAVVLLVSLLSFLDLKVLPIHSVFEIARQGHASTYPLLATCSPISALFPRCLSTQDH